LQVQKELEEERRQAQEQQRQAQDAIEAKVAELKAIEAARQQDVSSKATPHAGRLASIDRMSISMDEHAGTYQHIQMRGICSGSTCRIVHEGND